MAPIPSQHPSISSACYIIIGVVSGIVGIIFLTFLGTAVWVLCRDIWLKILRNPVQYQKEEDLRKIWNKRAREEQDRQKTAKVIIKHSATEKLKSQETCSLLMELVSTHGFVLSF